MQLIKPEYFVGTLHLLLKLMINTKSNSILEKYTTHPVMLCSFWKNLSGHFERFVCNHSDNYAFQRIVQIGSLTDFIKHAPHCLHSYEIFGLRINHEVY